MSTTVPPTSVGTGLPPVPSAPPALPLAGGAPAGVLLFVAITLVCAGASFTKWARK